MLTVRNLKKQINGKTIIEHVDFDIESGTVTGLVGRNGVGKSTLLRLMAGILDPDEGEVLFEGVNLTANSEIKKSLYYVPDSIRMFNGYNAKELVRLHMSMYEAFDEQVFYALTERFQLPVNRTIRGFSKGMKALLFIILALSTQAQLILLDEPTNGLDVIVKKQVMQLLLEEVSERRVALVISSHHLQELEKMADTVIFMKTATIDSIVRIEDMKESYRKVQVALADSSDDSLFNLDHVEVLAQVGRVTTLLVKSNVEETLNMLKEKQPLLLEELPLTMEDLFIGTLGGDRYAS